MIPVALRHLGDSATALWLAISNWSGRKGYCWWSQSKMAEALGWCARKVWRILKILQQSGLLELRRRGQGKPAFYRPILVPERASLDSHVGCESQPCRSYITEPEENLKQQQYASKKPPLQETETPSAIVMEAVERYYPSVSHSVVNRIVMAAKASRPDVSYESIAEAVHGSWQRGIQKTPGLFVFTVPEFLRKVTNRLSERRSAGCKDCSRTPCICGTPEFELELAYDRKHLAAFRERMGLSS